MPIEPETNEISKQHKTKTLDADDFETRIQLTLNKMNKHIHQLKNDLDHEKEKTKVLEERINNLLVLFDCIKRV